MKRPVKRRKNEEDTMIETVISVFFLLNAGISVQYYSIKLPDCGTNKTAFVFENSGVTFHCYNNENRIVGSKVKYSWSGIVLLRQNFVKGYLHGEEKVYYDNGLLREVTFYKDGRKNGLFQSFYEDGSEEMFGMYENNIRVGVWKVFDPSGKLVLLVDYGHTGKPIIKYAYD